METLGVETEMGLHSEENRSCVVQFPVGDSCGPTAVKVQYFSFRLLEFASLRRALSFAGGHL